MYPSSYLRSTGEQYRFMYDGNGNTYTLELTEEDPWPVVYNIWNFGTVELPGLLLFDPYHDDEWDDPPSWSRGSAVIYDNHHHIEYGIWQDDNPDGETFMRLDTDGCLRFYSEAGSNVYGEFCAPSPEPVLVAGLLTPSSLLRKSPKSRVHSVPLAALQPMPHARTR